jgi:predicted permease
LLRADPLVGRTLRAEDGIPGADHVAILSRAFWERHYGGARDAIGRTIRLDAQPYTIVGVMPASFDFPPSGRIDIWTPLSFDPNDQHGRSRRARALNVVGRLADGVSRVEAEQEMSVIAARLATTYPDSNAAWGARVVSAQEQLVKTVRPALTIILAAVGFLLLIVCTNVANLMLARLSSRRTEIAVRSALGAGSLPIVRQVLAESFVLAGVGGALGIVVAWASVRAVHALPEGSVPRLDDVGLDVGVLVFALSVSTVVAVLSGVVPALQASRAATRDTMRAFAGSAGHPVTHRLLGGLVVVEVALSIVLLVGAGLMTRSFASLMRVSPGFEPRALLAAQIYLPPAKYPDGTARTRFYAAALQQIRALPGVQSAAAVSALPLYPVGIDFALPFTIEGQAPAAGGDDPRADVRAATPGYFETMKMGLRKGRFIDERDARGAPSVMVINETMARRYFAGRDPIGRVIKNAHGRAEVVGIVADVKHYGLDGEPRPELFFSAWQQSFQGMAFVARTVSEPASFIDPVRRAMLAVDAEQPVYDSRPMADVVARSVFVPRISMLLVAAFALSALLLAAVGIYGVVSHAVTERTRELGVRMALGAEAADTVRLVIGRSMRLVAVGTVCGLLAAMLVTRGMAGVLFEVSPLDPVVLVAVPALLALAALVASLLPALRATRVDPLVALRVD